MWSTQWLHLANSGGHAQERVHCLFQLAERQLPTKLENYAQEEIEQTASARADQTVSALSNHQGPLPENTLHNRRNTHHKSVPAALKNENCTPNLSSMQPNSA